MSEYPADLLAKLTQDERDLVELIDWLCRLPEKHEWKMTDTAVFDRAKVLGAGVNLTLDNAAVALRMMLIGGTLQAIPQVRLCYEVALATQWARFSDAIVNSVVQSSRRSHIIMERHRRKGLYLLTDFSQAASLEPEEVLTPEEKEAAFALKIIQLTERFEEGDQWAHFYREMSRWTHVSAEHLGLYVTEVDLGDRTQLHFPRPEQPPPYHGLMLTATAAMWVVAAVDDFTGGKWKAELDEAGRILGGVPSLLTLSSVGNDQITRESESR